MSRVRPLEEADLPALAALWLRTFGRGGSPQHVQRYFREVFCEPPARAEGAPSLVSKDERGRVVGFVGALPRRMLFRKRPILAVAATQLMVEPGPGRALTAFELLRALFSGPQDLTFSDGSNEASLPIWQRMGGEVAQLYSLDWTRVLRPAGYAQLLLERRLPTVRAGRPLCRALDAAALYLPLGPSRRPRPVLAERDLSEDVVLQLLDQESYALRPAYDAPPLGWLLQKAAETRGHGRLRKRICCGAQGEPVGWYVYYAKAGGISKVLQLGGRASAMEGVLENLLADALREESVAVSGQVEPRCLRELTKAQAVLSCKGLDVVVQSRHPEILAAIHRGDAFLTRLDGEWWLRFAVDSLGGDMPRVGTAIAVDTSSNALPA